MSVNDISAEVPDWSREIPTHFWAPGPKLLQSIRAIQHWVASDCFYAKVMKKLAMIRYRFWSVVSGAEIPVETKIGGGLLIPHPNGIVINSDVEIGVNCLIHQQVTIGVTRGNPNPPKIGGHVDISAGAVVVGEITVGDHALIAANAVVTKNVPAYEVSGGVPAKRIGTTDK